MITNDLFSLGHTAMTRSVAIEAQQLPQLHRFVAHSLARHYKGDWGDVCKADADMNDYAVKNGERLVSTYLFDETVTVVGQSRIWIITEADRSSTTVLFPSDY